MIVAWLRSVCIQINPTRIDIVRLLQETIVTFDVYLIIQIFDCVLCYVYLDRRMKAVALIKQNPVKLDYNCACKLNMCGFHCLRSIKDNGVAGLKLTLSANTYAHTHNTNLNKLLYCFS